MKGTRTNEKIFWDSRARSYPLPFDPKTSIKTGRIVRLLAKMGVKIADKALLDIGCGTGAYALTLASRAKRTMGTDSSAAMLKVFRRVRRERGIRNAACLRAEWGKLPASRVKGRFDIALASMTAAVKTASDVRKMEAAATEKCVYIGWAGLRRNALLQKIYAVHGVPYKAPEGAQRTLRILRGLGRRPKTVYIKESWTKEASWQETLRELAVNMKVNGVKLKRAWTEELLRKAARGGKVKQLTRARKALIVWTPPLRKAKTRARSVLQEYPGRQGCRPFLISSRAWG